MHKPPIVANQIKCARAVATARGCGGIIQIMNIRIATSADKSRCLELLKTLNPDISEQAGDVFDSLLKQTRGEAVVAEHDDQVIGLATVSYNLAARYGGEYCQLEELIVDPGARGLNAGGALVQATVDRARQRGCAEYGLYLVADTEHNQPFYEKYGFEKVGSEMRQRL